MRKSSQGKMLKRGREQQQGNQRRQEFEKGRAGRKKKTAEMFSWDGFSVSALLTL